MFYRFVKRTGNALFARVSSFLLSPLVAYAIGEPIFRLFGFRKNKGAFNIEAVGSALVVRPDEIGDVTLTTSFIRELRRNLPRAWITLVVKPDVFNLVQLCPHVDEILTFECSLQGRYAGFYRHYQALRLAARSLWGRRFDLAIVPRWDTDHYHAAYVSYFSGARYRVGYSEGVNPTKMKQNRRYDRLYSHIVEDATLKHEVRRNLDLLSHIGGEIWNDENEVWLGNEDLASADELFRKAGVGPDEFVITVAPGSGNSRLKEWPIERFVELCRRLIRTYGLRIVLAGGPGEEGLGDVLERELAGGDVLNIVGKVPLRVSVAVLKQSRVFVGNDTGLMHLADAAGVPAIGIFGSSCHHRFGPWKNGRCVLGRSWSCGPCSLSYHKDRCDACPYEKPACLLEISTSDVMDAFSAVMSTSRETPLLRSTARDDEGEDRRCSRASYERGG